MRMVVISYKCLTVYTWCISLPFFKKRVSLSVIQWKQNPFFVAVMTLVNNNHDIYLIPSFLLQHIKKIQIMVHS